jgi:RimJ/RimL family protein N-acetyltransferase
MKQLFKGMLVRLAADSPEVLAGAYVRWDRDSEFRRLADSDPTQVWSEKKIKEWFEQAMEGDPLRAFRFSIHTLAGDKLIGTASLVPNWVHADAMLGIIIGDRDYWGRGFGTDAMELILQYGFLELNLHRITLSVHSYNTRARRVYEKVGLKVEGVMRGDTLKEGRRTDGIEMGILRREWMASRGAAL